MELLSDPVLVPPHPEPDPDAVQRFAAERDALRLAWELARPSRLAAVEAGPSLADPDAAADCRCSCHPRPASSLHAGGVECSCQPETEESRRVRLDALRELLDNDFGLAEAQDERRDAFFSAAERLGVPVVLVSEACPVSFHGLLDGFRFAVRERHGNFRVVVDPNPVTFTAASGARSEGAHTDDDVTDDVVAPDCHVFAPGMLLVSSGDAETLGDSSPEGLLVAAVSVLRVWLRRSACSHSRGPVDAVFCCDCGAPVPVGS